MQVADESKFKIQDISPEGGTIDQLRNKLGSLRNSVSTLRFTPIIGTEASVIGRHYTQSWRSMTSDFNAMLSGLRHSPGRDYLMSLMAQRGILVYTPSTSNEEGEERPPQTPGAETCSFREELIWLAHLITSAFSEAIANRAVPALSTFSVTLTDDQKITRLHEALAMACLAAYRQTVQGKSREHPDCPHMYERLLDLTYKFMGGNIPALDAEPFSKMAVDPQVTDKTMRSLHSELTKRAVTKERRNTLSIRQLEWLADLVYHSFSFNRSFYPTDDELAFRAALYVDSSLDEFDMRPSSTSAFEKGRSSLPKQISTWFTEYDEANSDSAEDELSKFHRALALILNKQYLYYSSDDSDRKFEPVAFSLSLDSELEKALRRIEVQRYCVALPVRAERPAEGEAKREIHQRWVLATFDKEHKYENPTWEWCHPQMTMDHEITGPVVVKLRGSTLYDLPEPISQAGYQAKSTQSQEASSRYIVTLPNEDTYAPKKLEPVVTLSEYNLVQDVLVIKSLPTFFRDILSTRMHRHFYFLGVSPSQWDVRLRIADFAFPPPGRDYVPQPWRVMIAINEEFGDYESSVLDSLGIQRWKGPLGGLAPELLQGLDDLEG